MDEGLGAGSVSVGLPVLEAPTFIAGLYDVAVMREKIEKGRGQRPRDLSLAQPLLELVAQKHAVLPHVQEPVGADDTYVPSAFGVGTAPFVLRRDRVDS